MPLAPVNPYFRQVNEAGAPLQDEQTEDFFAKMRRLFAAKKANGNEALLKQAAAESGDFARTGEAGYGNMTAEMAKDREAMRRLAAGQDSLSREQLRQGTQQNIAAQQSMAASASPQNAVMAARTGMNNANRANIGMSGQAAMAGIAERQAAQQALNQMNLGQREQDINVGLGSRQNQMTGLGANRPKDPKQPSTRDKILAGAGYGLSLFSDERLKTDVVDGDAAAKRALEALGAKVYRYKDPKYGAGKQLGTMAQALERAGLKQAVIDTDEGKAIDVGKLTGANTAMLASLAKRVAKVEGKK